MPTPYDDIIHLPHHVSQNHPQMPLRDRAAQFAPFAALTGSEALVEEVGRLTERRLEVDEPEAVKLLDNNERGLMDKAELAKRNFLSGMNCAQSVLCAFEAECGLDHETALKLASGFGAGMARMREVCGAVSGMFMAANLLFGPSDPSDKNAKDAHYAELQKLAEQFRKETGSIICRVMLGLEKSGPDSPVSESRTDAYYRKRPCADLCALAAGILENYLRLR